MSQCDLFYLLHAEWGGWNLMCIIVPPLPIHSIPIWRIWVDIFIIFVYSPHSFSNVLGKKPKPLSWHVPTWNLNACFLWVINLWKLHVILVSDFPLACNLFWVSCQSCVAYLSVCCLSFLVFNWTTGSFIKQLVRSLATVRCSMHFCDDIFM